MDEVDSQLANNQEDEELPPVETNLQVDEPAEARRVEETESVPNGHIDSRTLEAIGSHEHIRRQALELAYDLLRQTNRKTENSDDEIRTRFTEIIKKRNWAEAQGERPDELTDYYTDAQHLAYAKSAVQIFETYQRLGEKGLELPTHVAVVSNKHDIERNRRAGTEKALMFVDTRLLATSRNLDVRNRGRLELNFTDHPEGAQPVALTMEPSGLRAVPPSLRSHRPDVWVTDFMNRSSQNLVQRQLTANSTIEKSLAITGAENIIVSGTVGASYVGPVQSLRLNAEKNIYILNGANVGDNMSPVDIVARGGDVVQEGNVTFSSIKTQGDYVHDGGILTPQTRDGSDARLECVNGLYKHNGGNNLAEKSNVVIDDANVNRAAEREGEALRVELNLMPGVDTTIQERLPAPSRAETEVPEALPTAEAIGATVFTTVFAEAVLPRDLSGEALQKAFDEQYQAKNIGIDVPMTLENGTQAMQRTWLFTIARNDLEASARYQAFKTNARRCGWQADAMSETRIDGSPSYYQITLIRPVASQTQEA